MRVLMVSVQFHPLGYGAERQALALSRALMERDLYVRVATARFTGLPPFSQVDGIPVDRLSHVPERRPFRRLGKYTFVAGLGAYLHRRGADFDVFHCHMADYHIIPAVLVGRRLQRPVVVKVSSTGPEGGVQALRRLDSDHGVLGPPSAWLLAHASAIVAPSRDCERELIQQGFRSVHYIPNGVDTQRFHPASRDERARARQSLGVSGDGLVFGFLGRLHPAKAADVLLQAWFASHLPGSGAMLCLAGEGPQETELRTLVTEQGGASSVRFVGRVEPSGFLHALDAFVLPSHYEGHPNALLEAMASGLACVGTQIGGIVDLLEHGESGLLVPPEQVQPLASALEALAQPELRDRLGRAAQRRAAMVFSLPSVAQRYHQLYTQLTAGRGGEPDMESSRVRFAFGANWRKYLSVVDDARIEEAERTLARMLEADNLRGKSFLDVGCGSGLFSLAARRLGARVHSFDRDPLSVETTAEMKYRHGGYDDSWTIEEGSITANDYLTRLGRYDVVYAWGVLHHTGNMWGAIDNTLRLVANDGLVFLSIYNDQGAISGRWRKIKHLYNVSPAPIRLGLVVAVATYFETRAMIGELIRFRNPLPFQRWIGYKQNRGMSRWHDFVDWVGGYPFEVAKPEDVFDFCRRRGFELLKLKTCGGGLGCNEFVFRKTNITP